jgi:hypothetical protein
MRDSARVLADGVGEFSCDNFIRVQKNDHYLIHVSVEQLPHNIVLEDGEQLTSPATYFVSASIEFL